MDGEENRASKIGVDLILEEWTWKKKLWHKETGPIAWILCHLRLHDWRYNCNGWTNEEFETCGRCHKDRFPEELIV